MFYERRVVTLNVTSPYEYVSVSKPIHYTGTNQRDAIFTVSMSWDRTTATWTRSWRRASGSRTTREAIRSECSSDARGCPRMRNGCQPRKLTQKSHLCSLLARDLLTDHQMCDGMRNPGLW
jgi:hypothetical protein